MRKITLLVGLLVTAFVSRATEIPYQNSYENPEVIDLSTDVTTFYITDHNDDCGSNECNYNNDAEGYLRIVIPNGKALQLYGSVQTEEGCDFLRIYNGTTPDEDELVAEFSGYENMSTMWFTSDILLSFTSDESETYPGFMLSGYVYDVDANGFAIEYEYYGIYRLRRYFGEGGNITIPSKVTSIEYGAFKDCENITSIDFSAATNLYYISNSAFENSGLKEVTLLNKDYEFNDNTFAGLLNVNYTYTEGWASPTGTYGAVVRNGFYNDNFVFKFADDINLAVVKYIGEGGDVVVTHDTDNSITVICENAFRNNDDITSVTIPATVTSIGQMAFYDCDNLESVTFRGMNLTTIGECAFANSGLKEMSIPRSVNTIGIKAFMGILNINFYPDVEPTDSDEDNWGAMARNATVDGDFVIDGTTLVYCAAKSGVVDIPEGVTEIGPYAFVDCNNVSISGFGTNITTIGENAFLGVKNLVLPDEYNDELDIDDLPWGALNTDCNVDGDYVYADDEHHNIVGYIGKGGDVEIPMGITSIRGKAFSGCEGLTEVIIPKTVENIGAYAFAHCPNLKVIYYTADEIPDGWGEFWNYDSDEENGSAISTEQCYTINVTYESRMGNVEGYGKFDIDDMVTLSATAEEGFLFVAWSNQDEGIYNTNNPWTFRIDRSLELVAVFVELTDETYTVAVNDSDFGSVEGVGTYAHGTKAVLTAVPSFGEGFFVQWGDGSNKYFNDTIVVVKDTTCNVEFHEIQPVTVGKNTVYSTYGLSYKIKQSREEGEIVELGIGTPNPNCVFKPAVSGTYIFYTEGNMDTYGVLFNSDMTRHLAWNDDPKDEEEDPEDEGDKDDDDLDEGDDDPEEDDPEEDDPEEDDPEEDDPEEGDDSEYNFKFSCYLEKDKTYYISAGFYESGIVDDLTLQIKAPVNVSAEIAGEGNVKGTGSHTYGTEIELTADPDNGNFFVQWGDGKTNFTNRFTAVKDTMVQIEFHEIQPVVKGMNTVYATWGYSFHEDDQQKSGAKIDGGQIIEDEEEKKYVGTKNPNCVFKPTVSGEYTFYTEGNKDTYGVLFDSDMTPMAFNDFSGDEFDNFKIVRDLTEGETYYITAGFYYENIVDDLILHIDGPAVITVKVEGEGEVTAKAVGAEGEPVAVEDSIVFPYGTEVAISAVPAEDNFFVQWVNGSNGNFNDTIVAVKDTTFTAEFHEIQEVKVGENNVYSTYGISYNPNYYNLGIPNPNCIFKPAETGTYVIFTEGNKDTYGVLFDSEMSYITHNDDAGRGNFNFKIQCDLEANKEYYISAGFCYANVIDNIKLQVKAPIHIDVTADEERGTATVSNNGVFTYGEQVIVEATPASGNYEFLRWSDGSIENPYSFGAYESKTLEAIFKVAGQTAHEITATANNQAWGTVSGDSFYVEDETATLTAIPAEHYHFVQWQDNADEPNPREVKVSSDSTFVAIFAIDQHILSVLAQNGTPSIEIDSLCDWGSVVEINAQANEHYHFVKWSDGVKEETRSITILKDTTVTAIYGIDTLVVEILASNNGTVTGAGEYAYDTEATLEATAKEHYHFVKWSNDVKENPYKFKVISDSALSAVFGIDTFSVSLAETVKNGNISEYGDYPYGTVKTFEAVPEGNYKFVRWDGWTASDNKANPLEITIVEDVVLSPLFIPANKDLFTITVTANEGGTVTGSGEYLTDEEVTLKATPNEGYDFVEWNDNSNDKKKATRTITVTKDSTFNAKFRIKMYRVDVTAATNGTITGDGFYNHGDKATLTATPKVGYHFVKWSDDVVDNPRTITVTSNAVLTAEFAINNYTIAATAAANGTVDGAGKFDHGAEVTLTATAAAGYHFVKWSNNETANPYKFAAESDLTLTAEFAINTYEVTATAANGTVTGVGTYNHGVEVTLTANAAEGYSFVKWSDGVTEASRKVTVTSNLAFTAEFAINSYDVTATATNGVVEGTGKYNYGAEATLNAVVNKGYHFVKWSDDVTTETRKVTVKGNQSFTAVFAANTYTVTVTAEANGTVTGAGTYEYGTTATIEAKANDGFRFVKWSDGVKTAKRTIEVVGDTTLTASFAVRTYEITAEAKNGKVEGEGTYNRGDEVELTAKPNVGYHFVCWSDSVIENPRKVIVNNDTTVTALFEKEAITISVNGKFGKITGSTGKLEFGATVTLTAVPDSGYHFVMWSDSVLDNPRTVTLTAELLMQVQESGFEFSAIFEKDDEPGVAVADEAAEAVKIFAFGNTIAVENADSDIFVFNAMGRLICRTAPEAGRTEIKVNGTGIYVVKTGNAAKRVMIND